MIELLEGSKRELAEFMSELSEEAYAAGWMEGLEYALWYAVENGPMTYGRLNISERHLSRLKKLSANVGGWIYFDDDSEEKFIEIETWKIRFKTNFQSYANKIK